MRSVVFLVCFLHLASSEIHSHKFTLTAVSGIQHFPEFMAEAFVDSHQINGYDSTKQKLTPKEEWVKGAVDPDFWSRNTQILLNQQAVFKNNLEIARERFNHTPGVHTFQYRYGCEWDDETQQKNGFRQIGYDGEDFIVYETKNFQWIAPIQQAEITQRKWNNDQAQLEYQKNYITQECIEWLQKYLTYGKATLQRQVSPEVSLLQRDDASAVACHATGFYPDELMITWRRDGEEVLEDVDIGETLPNEDGTLQKRAVLSVSPEERKKSQYTCEVAHKSGKPIVITLTEKAGNSLGIIIGCSVVAALVVIGMIVGFIVMRKKDYKKAEQSDTDSENSNPIARKGAECGDC